MKETLEDIARKTTTSIVIGLASITYTYAQGTPVIKGGNPQTNMYQGSGGSVGINQNSTPNIHFQTGEFGSSEGKVTLRQNYTSQGQKGQYIMNENKTIDEQIQQNPTQAIKVVCPEYNFPTAKRYTNETTKAYYNQDDKTLYCVSNEALGKIEEGKLKATKDELKDLKHSKGSAEYRLVEVFKK